MSDPLEEGVPLKPETPAEPMSAPDPLGADIEEIKDSTFAARASSVRVFRLGESRDPDAAFRRCRPGARCRDERSSHRG